MAAALIGARGRHCIVHSEVPRDQNGPLLNGPVEEIEKQVAESLNAVPAGRLIVGPGCAVKVNTPDENLYALSEASRGWDK